MNNKEVYLADAIDVIEEVLASEGEFKLFPKGVSMLPLIVQDRDSVVLKRDFVNTAKRHDIAFYRRANGQFVLHRVMKVCKDNTYVMCGDNQTVFEKDVSSSCVIGVVTKIVRNGKEINIDGFWYSAYVALWTKMFIRKPVKFCVRAVRKVFRIIRNVFTKHS